LAILGEFLGVRDRTTEEFLMKDWSNRAGDQHAPMYQFQLANLNTSYQKAVELLEKINPAKVREISLRYEI
jgi:hypothetical protein